ncbi:MAG: glycerophosphodiester phosphodiesterase family protein [Deltaproteobacteria bacterium]|nr:glycerophosphodiester phosphodiesterase family protein [Deltaproteobacteria bacterium]
MWAAKGWRASLCALLLAACSAAEQGTDGGAPDAGTPITPADCLSDRGCTIPLVSAHRGLCAAEPENTLAAFASCEAAGVPMVEVDCRETADGAVVIMHDSDVVRTTDGETRYPGRTEVASLSLAEFEALVIDDPRCETDPDGQADRCHPPTLAALLEASSERLLLDIDFKAGDPHTLAEVILAHGAAGRVLFFDADTDSLLAYRERIPDGLVMPRAHEPAEFQALLDELGSELDLRWMHGDPTGIAEVAAVLDPHEVRLYLNSFESVDIWVVAAELLEDPEQKAGYLDRAWDALEQMRAEGADCFGTDFAAHYAAYLYPDGFGN